MHVHIWKTFGKCHFHTINIIGDSLAQQ